MKKHLILFLGLILFSCENDSYQDLVKVDTEINLKWNKAYPEDSLEKSITGLQWTLSYMGAKLPSYRSNIILNGNVIKINISKLGLTDLANQKLSILHDAIKNSNEYTVNNAIDLGRYATLLMGAPEHYYNIVNLPIDLKTLLDKYILKPERGYVNNSSVSLEHRIIEFSEQNGFNQVFVSKEIDPETKVILEFETIEILPNGQLRFGIFDNEGNRKNNANSLHSNAGKIAKCIWCHESRIQPLFNSQDNYDGFLSFNELKTTLLSYKESHAAMQNNLFDGVDFSQSQEHTLAELLYISFMEVSAERLSMEWNESLSLVQSKLSSIPTHTHDEFPFLGDLYYRNEVEPYAPFFGLTTSSNVREQSEIEVNYIE